MTPGPLTIHTDRTVSCGTVLWRHRGRLRLTVVVKAVFAMVHEGVAAPVGPGEIVTEDRHLDGSSLRSVEAASDLAPYLGRCDVLFTGHAYAIGAPVASTSVRLRMSRYGRWLLDKTIHVYGDRDPAGAPLPFSSMPIVYERAVGGPGTSNPAGTEAPNLADPRDAARPTGFGPIARRWPSRRLALGAIHPRVLEGPIADLPEAMPAEYFQAAPRDQQLEPLRGGEWLVLEGLDPTQRRVQTRLPASRGVARVALRRPGAPAAGSAVDLACDMLAIDGDRQTFSLSWRGCYEVPEGEAALPSLVVLAALEAPGVPADWTQILAAAAPRPRQTTVTLQAAQLAASVPTAALPFRPSRTPTAPPDDEPMTLTPGGLAAGGPRAALPFAPSGAPARPPSTDATPWSTQQIRPALVPERHAAPVKPAVSFGLGMRLSSAPLSVHPMPMPDEEDGTFDMDTLDPSAPLAPGTPPEPPAMAAPRFESLPPAVESPPPPPVMAELPSEPPAPPPVVAAPRSEPPPPPARALPPPPDPWARPPQPPPQPLPPPPPPPKTFERPAVAAMKGSFYAKFAGK